MAKVAEGVAVSVHGTLGFLIAKDKSHGGMPFNIFTRLYDTLVQSVVDYGAGTRGHPLIRMYRISS